MLKFFRLLILSIFLFQFCPPCQASGLCSNYFYSYTQAKEKTLSLEQKLLVLSNTLIHFNSLRAASFISLFSYSRAEVEDALKSLIETDTYVQSEGYILKYGVFPDKTEIDNSELERIYSNVLRDANNTNSAKDAQYFESFKIWRSLLKRSMPYPTSQVH